MQSDIEVRAEFVNGAWVLRDAGATGRGVRVDGATMHMTKRGLNFVQGYVVAVYGLEQEVAKYLNGEQLRALGVGPNAHLRPRLGRLVSLGTQGEVTKCT